MDLNTKKNIIKQNAEITIVDQCEIIGLSRSVYYNKHSIIVDKNENIIKKEIVRIFEKRPFYGHRRIYVELRDMGYGIGREKVLEYMKELNLKPIYPKKNLSIPNKQHKKYPYLLKNIAITKPNQVWAADITYLKLPTGNCYFMGIIDWYSRKILAYEISNTMDKEFCIRVLNKAIYTYGKPDIFNTDQGSQFTSTDFTDILKKYEIKISMDSVGRCLDNVIIERFFRTLKYEDFYIFKYYNMKELKAGFKEYIDFYNSIRKHSSHNYKTPDDVYNNAYYQIA